jgi:hypothetical protein
MIKKIILKVIKSRRISWGWLVARSRAMRKEYIVLVCLTEGKIPLGRARRGWAYIKTYLK